MPLPCASLRHTVRGSLRLRLAPLPGQRTNPALPGEPPRPGFSPGNFCRSKSRRSPWASPWGGSCRRRRLMGGIIRKFVPHPALRAAFSQREKAFFLPQSASLTAPSQREPLCLHLRGNAVSLGEHKASPWGEAVAVGIPHPALRATFSQREKAFFSLSQLR